MTTNGQIQQAKLEADRIEQHGEFLWRMSGSPPGELGAAKEKAMREALVDALAEVEPLRETVALLKEDLKETLDAMDDSVSYALADADAAGVDGEKVRIYVEAVKSSKPENVAQRMLDLVEAITHFYKLMVDRASLAAASAIVVPLPAPQRPKRPRFGSTTLTLFEEPAAVSDALPTAIAPVQKRRRTA